VASLYDLSAEAENGLFEIWRRIAVDEKYAPHSNCPKARSIFSAISSLSRKAIDPPRAAFKTPSQ
jgi:hypothetical protein